MKFNDCTLYGIFWKSTNERKMGFEIKQYQVDADKVWEEKLLRIPNNQLYL